MSVNAPSRGAVSCSPSAAVCNMAGIYVEVYMKKAMFFCFFIMLGLAVVGNSFGQSPGVNESQILINSIIISRSDIIPIGEKVKVTIGNLKTLELKTGEIGNVIVPNGSYVLTFSQPLKPKEKKSLAVTVESDILQIEVKVDVSGGIALRTISQTKLDNASSSSTTSNIEGAIKKITTTLSGRLPPKSVVAVLSISSQDRDMAVFAIDELEYRLVDLNLYKVVDRKTIDAIRNEQNFQMSGDVRDDSAVSIGNMLGANVVITGSITGSGSSRRLTIKALDVKTAEIIVMPRESF